MPTSNERGNLQAGLHRACLDNLYNRVANNPILDMVAFRHSCNSESDSRTHNSDTKEDE